MTKTAYLTDCTKRLLLQVEFKCFLLLFPVTWRAMRHSTVEVDSIPRFKSSSSHGLVYDKSRPAYLYRFHQCISILAFNHDFLTFMW